MTENNSELLKAADEMIEDFKSISDEDFGALYDLCENSEITCLYRDVNEMFDYIGHIKKGSVYNSPAHTP